NSPLAQWQLGLPHLLERSERVPRRNHWLEANWATRERKLRSAAESLARIKGSAISCKITLYKTNEGKQEQKCNTNLLFDRTEPKTIVESDVLADQKSWSRNRCPSRSHFRAARNRHRNPSGSPSNARAGFS